MKKALTLTLFSLIFIASLAHAGPDVDFYVDKNYDFAKLKRLYVWPAECENVPDNVMLSLPNLVEDWTQSILTNKKRMKSMPLIKSTGRVWQDVQLVHGPFDFDDPFENEETTAKFYSLLGDSCDGVLKTTLSVTQERRWQEPRTETYTTMERIRTVERRRNSKGQYENVEVYIDVPVTKERVIQGRWLTDTRAACRAELYDTLKLNGKFVAAAQSEHNITDDEGHAAQAARDGAKSVIEAALTSIFHKK